MFSRSCKNYCLPFCLALLVHVLLIVAMSYQVPKPQALPAKQPEIIKATLFDRKQLITPSDKAREKRLQDEKRKKIQRDKEKKRVEKKRQAQLKKDAEAKSRALELKQKKEALLKKQQKEKAKKESADRRKEEQSRRLEVEQEKTRFEQEKKLAEQLAQQEAANKAVQAGKDKTLAMSYMGMIRQVVEDNWSRPPSARNGMEALLEIHLVPNGTVVQVDIVKSSGNTAFDRAAVLAVEKAERFMALRKLPPHVFEMYYREFRLLFKPEDLRL